MENQNNMEQLEVEQVEVADAKQENNVQEEQEKVEEKATSISTDSSIGKFKDTESLLNAYNSLQAEFTRKCQKLSELENSVGQQTVLLGSDVDVNDFKEKNPELVQSIVQNYLNEIRNLGTPDLISNSLGSGIPLTAPPKPSTMDEARAYVKNLFK